jgi:hypothetical protein
VANLRKLRRRVKQFRVKGKWGERLSVHIDKPYAATREK